jgi:hypothetical protein
MEFGLAGPGSAIRFEFGGHMEKVATPMEGTS